MERRNGDQPVWSSLVLACFLWHCWLPNELTTGYYLNNCTAYRSQNGTNRHRVQCQKQNFYNVPSDIPSEVEALDVSFNFISQIKVGDFKLLTNLKYLNVSHNRIWHVEKSAFKDLITLRELNLAQNRLTAISNGIFHGLFNLLIIRLDSNLISRINSSVFSLLTNINTVNLSTNRLQHIKQILPIMKLPALQNLYIGKNNFSTFKSNDISNTSLGIKLLDLSWTPLEIFQITEDILPHLETLDISYLGGNASLKWDVQDKSFLRSVNRLNLSGIHISEAEMAKVFSSLSASLNNLRMYEMTLNIKTLVNEACQIPTVRVIRLKSNNITSLDDHLFLSCSFVNEMDVTSNKISHVSELAFKPLEQVKNLRLGHNKMTVVPSAIRHLPALEMVDLSFNRICNISCSDFAHLRQLSDLHLFHNHISDLSPCVFKDLPSLQTLKLGTNKLLSITGVFSGLQKLQHLELRNNKLSSIRKADFESLCSLIYLDLVDNQITMIENEAFSKLANLKQLDLKSNKITEVTINSINIFAGLSNLEMLFLSSNYISYDTQQELEHPPFSLLKSLTVLAINSQGHKGLRNLPPNLLKGLTSLRKLQAGNTNTELLHPDTFSHTPHLSYLDISKNVFTALTPQVFWNIPELTMLIITKARLQSLDFLDHANLSRLQSLQVKQNELAVINETLILSLPALTYLSMEENTFTCDCNNAWFIQWAHDNNHTQVVDAGSFTCNYPADLRGYKLLDLNTESCNVDIGFFYFISTTILVVLTLLGSICYHFLRWQVIYGYYLFLAFLYDRQKKTAKGPQDFKYDAFISYNARDEPWVLEELLPELENKQGWKLCLHHRDFEPGKPILDNIVDSIYSSRKTICLISRHYLESEWCSREIQVASFRLFDEKKDVLVLVFLEKIPHNQLSPYHRMRKLVKKHTYLSWPKPGQNTMVFWQKLRVALETKEGPDQENPILSGLEN
ncbi:toll-like receptor 22 [Anguilla anguilla]|uniref:toll-like receptor 22 n=1 Tax=Anguilla anguilla TaxID=7936 RepID=UPI0015A9CB74|nr:toll-like receptor 22 [Anguilla anguilla]